MAHFAELDANNVVKRVITLDDENCKDENGNESEDAGKAWLASHLGGNWIQTSYNNNIRGQFAGPDYVYIPEHDRFVGPKPFPSWVLNTTTWTWNSPTPNPDDTLNYKWDEQSQSWVL